MLRRVCFGLSGIFVAYCVLLTVLSHAGFPVTRDTHAVWPWLGDKPVGEDGFYMLTVGKHIAQQHRIAYNYSEPVTGIQPLATFLWAGLAVLNGVTGGTEWTLVRWVLFTQCMLFVLLAFLVATLASRLAKEAAREMVFFLAFVLMLFDFAAFRLCTYGLETGPYLLLLACCLLVWQRLVQAEPGQRWPSILLLGVAGGLTGLARIDFGLVFALVLLVMLVRRQASPAQVLVCGALALACVSPWFLYVHRATGGWLPSSGKAEGGLITMAQLSRLYYARVALLTHLVPWSFASANDALTGFAELCLLALAAVAIARRKSLGRVAFGHDTGRVLLPWLVGMGLLVLVYPTFFWVGWFYPRYYAPLLLVWVPLLAMFLAELPWVRRVPLACAAVLLVIFAVQAKTSLHTGRIATNHIISAGYVRTYYPRVRVGAYQSGVLGYFDPNVVNLDGKMNDQALRADQHHDMPGYLDRSGVQVLVDWESFLRGQLPAAYLASKWQPCPQPMPVPDSICLVRTAP